ncbi:hypothetical protein NLX86_18685 [Streptomyces sp. A3M-1-3]|uniref:hypothetical protein n=1 Tax=Streptomyces sp. A3M-1-3 TaxID=2962044 RepID=UPI0020B86CB5|nr:hypothetical protein [Streptomyces sp. A3M-1-3]MCP3820044.1 hypothetical protein [Streptomyces sp. A3M-1-3]
MNTTQSITNEAIDAIENLTNAADAFVAALQAAAVQDTNNRGYWAGYIAQIKHVTEQGSEALLAPWALLVPAPDGSAARVRLDALFDARQALEEAYKVTFRASVLFGRNDDRVTA